MGRLDCNGTTVESEILAQLLSKTESFGFEGFVVTQMKSPKPMHMPSFIPRKEARMSRNSKYHCIEFQFHGIKTC